MYSAQVTLVESDQPAVQDEGGGLWGSGPVWGTVPLTFDGERPVGDRPRRRPGFLRRGG